MTRVTVAGAGLAGSAAAISALSEGAAVTIYERSRMPRHKVCGEFLSPGTLEQIGQLGLPSALQELRPARMRRMLLRFTRRETLCRLPESAWGLSRYALDDLLLRRAVTLGANLECGTAPPNCAPMVDATGRREPASGDGRLFGFKAHFRGPADDAVELYFFKDCYVGVSPVEGGLTNVCGLAPVRILRSCGFDIDALLASHDPLRGRLEPLTRTMKWLFAGPLVFGHHFDGAHQSSVYPAGDALSFVDPFTGSGMLAALFAGRAAGAAAAKGWPRESYLNECRRALVPQLEITSLFRRILALGWADWLSTFAPGRLLLTVTRPWRI